MLSVPQVSDPVDRDGLLAIACGLGLAMVALLLGLDQRPDSPSADAPALARLAHAQGRVMLRPAGTLEWEPAASGQGLRASDSIYVPPGASASVEFATGSTLELEERSLVIVESPETPQLETRLALLKGTLSGSAGAARMTVRAGGREAAVIGPGASARVTAGPGGPRLEVLAGGARLGGTELAAAPAQVRLDAPARNQRIWSARFPATVSLTWDGLAAAGLKAQAARDERFEHLLESAPAEPGRMDVEFPQSGSWFWRIADADGRPRSETRRLVLAEDLPPRPFSPMAGEIVLAPVGVQVPFWWTAVDAASRYRLEIAAEPSFRNLAFSGTASGPGLWVALDLPEGVFYWRVRVDQPERGSSPFSAHSPFRLIHQPLPDAPRLFDPTLEVEHGAAR